MTSTPRSEKDDSLNESWVELQYAQHGGVNESFLNLESGGGGGGNGGSSTPYSTGSGNGRHGGVQFGTNMEKLLMEAQRESRSTSREGSQGGSPKGPHSPVLSSNPSAPNSVYSNGSGEKQQGVPVLMGQGEGAKGREENWIWDWSSRPEPLPPKEFRFKHPDKTRLSLRKSKAMRSNFFSAEILSVFIPSLFLTNLFALGMGVFIGLKMAAPRSS
ncbi:BCL2/adenovirus E1B 19 kDa protein-interacting protein 3 isoform X1 [Strongylocentrotus purpuratus]|uniref:BCL2/adenovirus E1B 19 kDa protein-interacting protein 3-like n=1 Tax=Strongylocentrotus purpuratus TaxID=7668 RepID=A0A7M7RDI2_STRPU|nr:BCL2/adenovirus E1B 19 kDa protein-interacting protein 3 isoform X1 [Strongylocentrotus purpuratus]